MKILAVVVTYNRPALLKKVIAALDLQSAPCDILLVNNAGTGETEDWALAHADEQDRTSGGRRFIYENTGANLGGAGGFQYGMRKSVELGYDQAWVMDDDAVPAPDALEKLLKAQNLLSSRNQPFGFLSGIVRWTDGSLCEMNRQRIPGHYITEEDVSSALSANELIPAESATFVSLLIPTETILKVGLPIREFFIWCDDVEFTSRITQRYRLPAYIVPDSEVLHETKNNTGSDIVTDDADRIDRYFFAVRNGGFAYRHYSFRMYATYIFHQFLDFFRIWLKAKDHKARRSRVLISGFLKGLVFRPEIEYITKTEEK